MDEKTKKALRADVRRVLAAYEPGCGEEAFEDTVLRLAAIGARLAGDARLAR